MCSGQHPTTSVTTNSITGRARQSATAATTSAAPVPEDRGDALAASRARCHARRPLHERARARGRRQRESVAAAADGAAAVQDARVATRDRHSVRYVAQERRAHQPNAPPAVHGRLSSIL